VEVEVWFLDLEVPGMLDTSSYHKYPVIVRPGVLDTSSYHKYPVTVRQLLRLVPKIPVSGRSGIYNSDSIAIFPTINRIHAKAINHSRLLFVSTPSHRYCSPSPMFAGAAHRCCILHPRFAFCSNLIPLVLGDGEVQLYF